MEAPHLKHDDCLIKNKQMELWKKQGKVAKTCYHHAALVLIIHYGWTNLMLTPYNIFPTFQMPRRPFRSNGVDCGQELLYQGVFAKTHNY